MRLLFASEALEAQFAVFLALRSRRLALALCSLTLALWLSAFTRVTLLAAAASTLVARRAVLLAATAVGTAMQGLAIQVLADPAKAVYHEQVKTRQTLVSMTVCMVCAILANPDELNLKSPVAMFVSRSVFHLAERYRLVTLLHLQMINLVCFTLQEVDLALWSRKTGGSRTWGDTALDAAAIVALGEMRAHAPRAWGWLGWLAEDRGPTRQAGRARQTARLARCLDTHACEALPLFIRVAWEARLRSEFLRRARQPASQLGPFWAACMRWTAAPQ